MHRWISILEYLAMLYEAVKLSTIKSVTNERKAEFLEIEKQLRTT
jgi:hypothetical protein